MGIATPTASFVDILNAVGVGVVEALDECELDAVLLIAKSGFVSMEWIKPLLFVLVLSVEELAEALAKAVFVTVEGIAEAI